MKKEQISDSLNMLDDAIIEETNEIRRHKKGRRKSWGAWAAAAACLALLAYAGIRVLPQQSPDIPPDLHENFAGLTNIPTETPGHSTEIPDSSTDVSDPSTQDLDHSADTPDDPTQASDIPLDLPLLSISERNDDGMGYSAYWAYDISELVNGNPWSETMELTTLPVYQNRLTFDNYFVAYGVDFDAMKEFLLEIAGRLGLDTSSLVITDNTSEQEWRAKDWKIYNEGDVPEEYYNPTKYMVEAEGVTIEVDQTMTAEITFDPPHALPEGYHFKYDASYEDNANAAEYLKNKYRNILRMENPRTNIYSTGYGVYLDQAFPVFYVGLYEAEEDIIDTIINYNFYQVDLWADYEDRLRFIRIYHPDLSLKVGDYPIITVDKARKLLLAGSYITSVPFEIPSKDSIKKVELVYYTGELEEYFMPFYCFYVEVPDEEPLEGLKTYGIYYVPAVEGRYLTNMPVWDGQIN